MTFVEYLISKKIDRGTFLKTEPELYKSWEEEFQKIHPNSFTSQKLYLINPLRRKYLLKVDAAKEVQAESIQVIQKEQIQNIEAKTNTNSSIETSIEDKSNTEPKPVTQSVKPARPVFKPKPKIN